MITADPLLANVPIEPYKGRDAGQATSKALELYEQGIEVEQSAPIIGVPARTLYRWLSTNAADEWKEAQQGRALADFEKARKAREEAANTLNDLKAKLDEEGIQEPQERNWRLAHAREVLKAADTQLDHQKWLIERLIRKLYGQDRQVQVTIDVGDLGERLRRAKERVIDADAAIPENP